MRCPFSRRRLISISLRPASLPAACCALGRPRTTTDGLDRRHAVDDGAGALGRADRLAPRPAQDPGEREVHALECLLHARAATRAADGGAPRSSRRRSRSACAARRCTGGRSPSGDRCSGDGGSPRVRIRSLASPLISMPEQLPDLIHVVARLPLGRRAREQIARRGHPVHRVRGDAARVALLPRDPEVAELQLGPPCRRRASQTNRFIGVRSRCSVWPRWSFRSTSRMPAISRRTTVSDRPFLGSPQERAEIAVDRVLERQVIEDLAVGAHQRKQVEDADGARDAPRGAARSTPRGSSRRCAG